MATKDDASTPSSAQESTKEIPDYLTASKTETVTQMLERYMQGYIYAINIRDFSKNSPYWQSTADDFRGEAERPFLADAALAPAGLSSWEENMAMFKYMAEEYPDYRIRIWDLKTDINQSGDKATMIWNGETAGLPGGLVQPSVGMCEFRLFSGGEWKCTRFYGARGTGDGID